MYQLANLILGAVDSNFIGIFLYGSQNYNLNTENSDRDIIILVKENKTAKRELGYDNGVAKIYALKYFLSRLQKGDMECYEILYTQHRFINQEYEDAFNDFVINFTKVINLDRIKYALALKLSEHLSNVCWIPLNRNNEKYHRKRVYWCYRVSDQLARVIAGEDLESTFIYDKNNREELLNIKTTPNYLSLKDLDKDLKRMVAQLKSLPKYDINVTEAESKCLSGFYNTISSI